MEITKTEIYDHDNEIEIAHKMNTIELENWLIHLKYIKKEVVNLIRICGGELTDKLADTKLLERLQKKEIENDTLLSTITNYMNSRDNIVECEDNYCDMIYIREHENYRMNYLNHLGNYRKVKDKFFEML